MFRQPRKRDVKNDVYNRNEMKICKRAHEIITKCSEKEVNYKIRTTTQTEMKSNRNGTDARFLLFGVAVVVVGFGIRAIIKS